MRESVLFYRSFYEAAKELPDEEFKKVVCAIMDYGLDDIEPEIDGFAKALFTLIKPQIDANNRRYVNGTKGGRKPNNNQCEIKTEPKENLNETKTEPNNNQDKTKIEPKEKEKVKDKEKVNVKDNNILAPSDVTPSSCAGKFKLNDGTDFLVSENDVDIYQQLYPAIDVRQELRNIEAWCLSNPANRKTRNGAKRFMNGWFSREQNRHKTVFAQKDKFEDILAVKNMT